MYYNFRSLNLSSFCLINIKDTKQCEENIKKLIKELDIIALNNNIEIIQNVEPTYLCCFFELGINFNIYNKSMSKELNGYNYKSFISLQNLILESYGSDNELAEEQFREMFIIKFHFFKEIIEHIFRLEIDEIEIYLSENESAIINYNDFLVINTDFNNFLDELFNNLVDELQNNFNYILPTIKFIVHKK